MAYKDLRDYLDVLEKKGKLHHISKEVDKDWEIAAVGRRVFQRFAPSERPALFFERVKGSPFPLVAGILGGSREIYALAMETTPDQIAEKWRTVQPVEPVILQSAPCKENILKGEEVDLLKLPIPTWTVEHDPGPYLTSPYVVTRDPDTGMHNMGTYRMQLKGKDRTGLMPGHAQHGYRHILKYEARGEAVPIAVVLGADPIVGLVSVAKMTHGAGEYEIAGGMRGEALPLVPCETIPLLVPASAEIVLEGELTPNYREQEGPFGEYTGYMGPAGNHFLFRVKCITHRNKPIYQAFISQMPPSESSCIRGIGNELPVLRHLQKELGLPVRDAYFPESGGSTGYLIISMDKEYEGQVQQAVMGAWGVGPGRGKIVVVVDSDIDIRDHFQVEWALSFRVRPENDIYIFRDMVALGLDPAQAPPEVPQTDPSRKVGGKVAIDATKKHNFPPLALPPKKHLEIIDSHWDEYGF